jgi:hypothetical protein
MVKLCTDYAVKNNLSKESVGIGMMGSAEVQSAKEMLWMAN